MSRLTIDITEQQHQALKAMAALQGKTIKAYALERIFPPRESSDDGMAALRSLLQQRMAESIQGKVSTQSITEIAEEVLQSGGSA